MTRSVTVRVPAKINLHLSVGDLRPDGYHDLVTVYQALDLYDEVTVTPAAEISVRTPGYPEVPTTTKNLAWKAALQLLKLTGSGEGGPVAIEIDKQIPVAGGMAGGSADAAATLLACNTLWGLDLSRSRLAEIAEQLGSDVPFALAGGTAVGTGRGEKVAPVLLARHQFHWVLALADSGLSTPKVFAELDRLRAAGPVPRVGGVDEVLTALATGTPEALAATLGNDLQAAAISLNPALRRTLNAAMQEGGLAGIVSGSGPTIAILCADAESAADVAANLAGRDVCRSVRVASGPVPGAKVVDRT